MLVTGGLDALWQATVDGGRGAGRREQCDREPARRGGRRPLRRRRRRAREARRGARAHPAEGVRRGDRRRSATPGFSAEPYLAQEAVSDTRALEPIVDAVLAANPAQVEQYRGGKDGLLGFFVGQVMKETKGQADPRSVNELVRAKLAE